MAEGLFRHLTQDKPGQFQVSSAGVGALDGFAATAETVRAMKEEGIDMSGHRTRRLTEAMVRDADKIFVMEEMHRQMILRLSPDAADKVFLLSEFSPRVENARSRLDIPDPIRMPDSFYRNVLNVIRDCVKKIIEEIEYK